MSGSAWDLLRRSATEQQLQAAQSSLHAPPKPLSNAEQLHVKRKLVPVTWDEGVIAEYTDDPRTHAWKCACPLSRGVLYLFTHDDSICEQIIREVDAVLSWLGTPPGFSVYLWWRDDPRTLAVDEWPSRRNVNGGFAVPGEPEVFIYRSEEYDRVIIHETIHAMKWDWEMPNKPLACWKFKKSDILSPHLFEAWTELYAEWLWCGWHNVPWEAQRAWQDYQAGQILARTDERWVENTNVFAYYVLKAALAPHIHFLWTFGNGTTAEERTHVLCTLAGPHLEQLYSTTVRVEPLSSLPSPPRKTAQKMK